MKTSTLITLASILFVNSAAAGKKHSNSGKKPEPHTTETALFIADTERKKEQSAAVFLISSPEQSGTGFACVYKGLEFVMTNLHVLDGTSSITVKSQVCGVIPLSGNMIAGEDADICLLGVQGSFKDKGIKPFEFCENTFKETRAGDSVVCLGNSLGNGVITETNGKITAFGTPRLEIDCPVVHGNSGGPVIHLETGKVVGIVTEAVDNNLTLGALGVAAIKSMRSPVRKISYFAHRIDSVSKWTPTSVVNYLNTSLTVASARKGLSNAALFLADKQGWEKDKRLSDAWTDYQKFMKESKDKTHVTVKVTDTVSNDEYGFTLRRDVRIRSMNVAQADYDKAFERFKRAVEWKILADQEILTKAKVIGYRQAEARNFGLSFSAQVLSLSKEL